MTYHLLTHILPILLWMAQIFATSAQSNPADMLPRFFLRFTWSTRIFGQRLFFLLGPWGHLVNFGVLAFLIARAFAWRTPLKKSHALLAVGISFLYGISDEIHQVFVPDRTFQVRDILVDGLGALIGVGVYAVLCLRRAQKVREESLLL